MGTGRSILERMWVVLDELMDGYFALSDTLGGLVEIDTRHPEVERQMRDQAHRAHGVCEMIAIVHHPYLADTDAVWAEAVARYQARQAGVHHVSPGVSF